MQYWEWLSGLFHGNLGNQYFGPTGVGKVSTALGQALPVSLQLMAYTMILTIIIAIPLGVLAAYRSGTRTDKVINTARVRVDRPARLRAGADALVLGRCEAPLAAVAGLRVPDARFRRRTCDIWRSPRSASRSRQIAAYMRLLRSDMIATLQEDFILMAKAKGITNRRILWRHALRPSSLTLLTVAGLNVGALIGGTVVIEIIFGLPGMGTLLYTAIAERQYVMLQSLVVVIAVGYVLVNVLIDILYSILDPRLRHARAIA